MGRKTKSIKNKTDKEKILRTPKGMHDVLPGEWVWRERVEKVFRNIAEFYNFKRIETPILEYAEVFNRGVGEESDMVEKEMYVLKTKGGDELALRPEGTAPFVRAYLEHGLGRLGQPQKLFSCGPFFRHENPQAGRYRQFTQANLDIIGGTSDPIYDSEIILIFQRLLEELKVKNIILRINSIGCKVCRPLYKKQLQIYYKNKEKNLCSNCQRRLKTNPLRLLDCKNEKCREFLAGSPDILDRLCAGCRGHLKEVLEYLDELKISYHLDNKLVRGLDYYSRTVFEFYVEGAGGDVGALPGGGRYDYLAETMGARIIPAVGGATGVERLVTVMKAQEIKVAERLPKKIFVIHVGEAAKKKSLMIMENLRRAGIGSTETLSKDSLRSQLKSADREGAKIALIFGQKEIFENAVIVRDLETRLQETVSLDKIGEEVRKRLK